MMNIIDIILLKYPNISGVTYWETQYDGTPWGNPYDGLVWENIEHPKPAQNELDNWFVEFDLQYRQRQVEKQRKAAMPNLQQQLDMQFNDEMNGTTTWRDSIEAIKLAYPIPLD